MAYRVDTITAATAEPVTLDEAKEQLRVRTTFTEDDAYITRLITVARDRAEKHCTRFFSEQSARFTWNEKLPGSDPIVIPFTLINAVTRVSYDKRDGTSSVIDSQDYTFNANNNTITPSSSWPGDSISYLVEVDSKAPIEFSGVKQAILMMVTDMYENRTQSVVGTSVATNPAVEQSLAPYREQMGL